VNSTRQGGGGGGGTGVPAELLERDRPIRWMGVQERQTYSAIAGVEARCWLELVARREVKVVFWREGGREGGIQDARGLVRTLSNWRYGFSSPHFGMLCSIVDISADVSIRQ